MSKLNAVIFVFLLGVSPAFAGGPTEHGSQASAHASLATSHALTASGQVVSGAVALPLLSAGQVGRVSGAAGTALMKDSEFGKPLPVTNKVVTAGPPPKVSKE